MKSGYMYKKDFENYKGDFFRDTEDMKEYQLREIIKIVEDALSRLHETEKMEENIKKHNRK